MRDQADPSAVGPGGVKPTLEQLSIESTAAAQDALITALIHTAGLPDKKGTPVTPLGARDANWSLVYKAGVYQIGRQCDQYLDALFRFNREQRASRQGLAATAATTAGIMGLTGVGATAIAVTAAAFGLTTALFDATVNSVLFTIEPSALRNVAQQGLQRYIVQIDANKIDNRPDTLIALQGYLTQCSPAAIEANINNAASGAPSVASSHDGTASKAAMLAAPNSALLVATGTSTVKPADPPKLTVAGAIGPYESILFPAEGRLIEAALCVTPEPAGSTVTFGPGVRNAIDLFRGTKPDNHLGIKDGLTADEGSLLTHRGSCDRTLGAKNVFESVKYSTAASVLAIQHQLANRAPAGKPVPNDGTLGPATRDAIKAVQQLYCQPPSGELTRKFTDMLVDDPPKSCPAGA